jgi:outer membrane murein-binding lipoprotein Lpp
MSEKKEEKQKTIPGDVADQVAAAVEHLCEAEKSFRGIRKTYQDLDAELKAAEYSLETFHRDLSLADGPKIGGVNGSRILRASDTATEIDLSAAVQSIREKLDLMAPDFQRAKEAYDDALATLSRFQVKGSDLLVIQEQLLSLDARRSQFVEAVQNQEVILAGSEEGALELSQLYTKKEDLLARVELGEVDSGEIIALDTEIEKRFGVHEARLSRASSTIAGLERQIEALDREAEARKLVLRVALSHFLRTHAETVGKEYLANAEALTGAFKKLLGINLVLQKISPDSVEILGRTFDQIRLPAFNLAVFDGMGTPRDSNFILGGDIYDHFEECESRAKDSLCALGLKLPVVEAL